MSALTLCPACQEPLPTQAEICPHCGAITSFRAKRNRRILLGIILLLFVASLIYQFAAGR